MNDISVWIAIFILGLFCLNWPLLGIFHDAPFVYLLIFWLLFVLVVARVARGAKTPPAR